MPRLRNTATGVVVNVSDERAATYPAHWERMGSSAPAQSAVKADWVEHAVTRGADRDEAEAMTKAELVEAYS